MKILGVIPVYNEDDCISNAISVLLRACDRVDVFDHGSTDMTAEIIREFSRVDKRVRHIYADRNKYPIAGVDGRQVFVFWYFIASNIIAETDRFDWVVWADADEILRQPNGAIVTKEAIERESQRGTDAIRPLLRQFRLSTADAVDGDYLHRMRHYQVNPKAQSPRAWRIHLTPPNLPDGAHVQDRNIQPKRQPTHLWWPNGTRVSNNEWLLDNYPFRSAEQATEKILNGRNYTMPNGQRRFRQNLDKNGNIRNLIWNASRLKHEHRDLEMPT